MAVAASRTRPPAPAPKAPAPARKPSPMPARAAAHAPAASQAGHHAGPAVKLVAAAEKDPRFKKAVDRLNHAAHGLKQHPPSSKEVADAQAAAEPPAHERLAGAQANKVDAMDAAPPGKKPDPDSFLAMLRAEIRKVMPKKTEDAGDFMKGDDRQQLKSSMTGNIEGQKSQATQAMDAASKAPADPDSVPEQKATPLPDQPAPQTPATIGAANAMPERRPESEVTLQPAKQDTDRLLKDADVTPKQLQKANDPRFSAVLTAKSAADQYADKAPQGYRATEQHVLAESAARAAADEHLGLAGLRGVKGHAGKAVREHQLTAKEKDEAARKKVVADIQGMFTKTKDAVDKKLASLDDEVSATFDAGADAAVQKMRDYVDVRFRDRYSGLEGKALKLKDWALPLPDSVKAWFDESYEVFQQELDALVVRVSNLVETRLKEAKQEIARGQREIRAYVEGLKGSLQDVGKAAEKEVQGQFQELSQGVDDKRSDLAQKLAQRYRDATEKGAAALKEMRDAHKSLYERVRDAIEEVIEVLRNFKKRIMAILKEGQETIGLIVADPIGFLQNLLAAIAKGVRQFVDRIWDHLKQGFMGWLFGSIAETGIAIPKDFSLGSILMLVLSILGLTYERIRAKAVKLIGERNVGLIERAAGLIKELIDNPAKFWETIKEHLSNLKETIFDAVTSWLVTTIVKAAAIKLISMFNPAGAIIQAIITIYNTVMFFIERINQILSFVEAVISSIHKIALGVIDAAANWIEQALARTLPLIISFLARLLGITGIAEKIQGVIKKLQATVDRAIDKVIDFIVGKAKGLFHGTPGTPGARSDEQASKSDDRASKDVKGQVKAELAGRKIDDPSQEESLIASVYDKYRPLGLKSIQFAPSKERGDRMDVIVSASLAERVAQLDLNTDAGLRELGRITSMMQLYAGRTTIFVYYGRDHKLFRRVTQVGGQAGHAEHRLKLATPELMERIRRERPPSASPHDTVPIHLDINRTPCDGCATSHIQEIVQGAAIFYPDIPIRITIAATSISTVSHPTTEKGVKALLESGVELTTSRVWDEIKRQMQAQNIQQFEYRNKVYNMDKINQFIEEAREVQSLIDKTVAKMHAERTRKARGTPG